MNKHRMCECCRTNFLLKDMKGDLCIVCYDFIQTRQNDKITDLEAKLAESEKIGKGFIELYEKEQHKNYELFKEVEQLKQQLAEKGKEIEELNYRLDLKFVNYTNNEALKWLDNQTAIEVLEKVKNLIDTDSYGNDTGCICWSSIEEIIDQQIKLLKGEK